MALRFSKHIRLGNHDYLQGTYFVTLCTSSRKQVFGRIVGTGPDARMELSDIGRIVFGCWYAIPDHFPHVRLHEMQIMPDHLHAIIELTGTSNKGTLAATLRIAATDAADPYIERRNGPRRGSLGAIIGAFKSESTKRANSLNGSMAQRLWQPNYFERTIREFNGESGRIARYIIENPQNWR